MDWRQAFLRYADYVGEQEGIYYLAGYRWTDEERKEIADLFRDSSQRTRLFPSEELLAEFEADPLASL